MKQTLWIAIGALPFLLIAAAIAYGRQPKRHSELRLYTQRLPRKLAFLKAGIRLALLLPAAYVIHDGLKDLHRVAHGDGGVAMPGYWAGLLMLEAALLAAAIPAYAGADLISAAIPPLRRAELAAREGLQTLRLGRNAFEMLAMGVLMTPAALAQGVLAALEPWAR